MELLTALKLVREEDLILRETKTRMCMSQVKVLGKEKKIQRYGLAQAGLKASLTSRKFPILAHHWD